MNQLAKGSALLAAGLLAGAFYYATFNVLPAFGQVSTPVHLIFRTTLMRYNALNMQFLMASVIITCGWFAWTVRQVRPVFWLAMGALGLSVATLLITRWGNVPINLVMKTWVPTAPPAHWQATLTRWNGFHTARTATTIAGFVCLLVAVTLLPADRKMSAR